MPALPTISPTQPQFDRIVAAFPGDTNAKKVESYKAWLTNHLIDHVQLFEARKIEEKAQADKTVALEQARQSLPPRVNYDPNTGVVSEPTP